MGASCRRQLPLHMTVHAVLEGEDLCFAELPCKYHHVAQWAVPARRPRSRLCTQAPPSPFPQSVVQQHCSGACSSAAGA